MEEGCDLTGEAGARETLGQPPGGQEAGVSMLREAVVGSWSVRMRVEEVTQVGWGQVSPDSESQAEGRLET